MEQGPTEKFIVEQAQRNKVAIPKAILDAPTLQAGLDFYLKAFFILSSCRQIGMSESRIPWTAANDYSLRYGLSEADFDALWELISAMDTAYLNHQAKKHDKKEAVGRKPPTKGAPPRRR